MKRRRFIQALASAPATGLIAQQAATAPPAPPAAAADFPKLDFAVADAVANGAQRFFSASQFAALQKLGSILMPSVNGAPGAIEARADEFLDFLLRESPAERQQLYRTGLDGLTAQARRRFNKAFPDLEPSMADELLAPLREPWKYDPPADPVARFLAAAKVDIRTATINSLEWSAAAKAGRVRAGAAGLYWYPID